jgi:S-adenosylmethionine:tRNA ribosyltransferase-isomerase
VRVADFDFELPQELIAVRPAEPRDTARLLVLDRARGELRHRTVLDLASELAAGDLLVVNDTLVLPHRLIGRRPSGRRVEALILERRQEQCRGYLRPLAKLRQGEVLAMEGGALQLRLERILDDGQCWFQLQSPSGEELGAALQRVGRAPLPPYLKRADSDDPKRDRRDYQTLFAARPGAVAAPTAGLHFTPRLLEALAGRGVEVARVTLHVGEGTFAPVRVAEVEQHRMHREDYQLPAAAAAAVAAARARGARVVAVGTTAARVLESCASGDRGLVHHGEGTTDLFLYPGRAFKVVDALLTNFHLPRSTLLMLVCAFAGRDVVLAAYRDAVQRGYRFYSFGDAMLLL